MKKASTKKPKMTPAELLGKPPMTARRGTKKAIVVTPHGSVYVEPYPKNRKWLDPVDAMEIAERVQALRRAEDEEPAPDDAETIRKRKQNEKERRRPKRHQRTVHSMSEAVAIASEGFLAEYPGKRPPFTQATKATSWKRTTDHPPWRIVIRRRHPLLSLPQTESGESQDSEPRESSRKRTP